MPHLFRTIDQHISKASQALVLSRADGTWVEGIWGGSAQEEKLDWWLRKPGNELTQTEKVAAVAVRDDETGVIRWGEAPSGSRLLFVLEPPVTGKLGETYRIAKMVTAAATPEQHAYFHDERFALLAVLGQDGSITRVPPLPPPSPEPPVQGELF